MNTASLYRTRDARRSLWMSRRRYDIYPTRPMSGDPDLSPRVRRIPHWQEAAFAHLLSEPVRNGVYRSKEFHGRGAKMVNMGELFAHPRLADVPMKRVELDEAEKHRFSVRRGDLLFARRSLVAEGAGKCCVVLEAPESTAFESSIIRARPDRAKADSLFLYYYFNSPAGLHGLDSIRRQVAVAGITGTDLANLKLLMPPLPEQRTIARILGTLDDKIELNRRMNETLEAIARAVFKSWFVDFEPVQAKVAGRNTGLPPRLAELFPEALDSRGRPAGWKAQRLDRLFDVSIGRTPPRKERHHFVPRGLGEIWLSIKTMGNLQTFALASEEGLTTEAVDRFRIPRIPAGTVMVSFKLTMGRVAIAAQDMYSNEAIAHLHDRHDTPVASPYTYCYMKGFDYDALGSTSSIATAVNSKSIKAIEMALPDAATHAAFDAQAQPLFDRILRLTREMETLANIRDELLPKLISGAIHIADAEGAVETLV